MDSAANVDRTRRLNRYDLQDSTDAESGPVSTTSGLLNTMKFSGVAALSTFVNDVSPTVKISRVFQVNDTSRTVALTCLFAWWPSQFAVVTSVTVPFVMCCWSLVTQKVNETHHYRVNRSKYLNNFRSNEISASFKRRSQLFREFDLRQTANNFVLSDDNRWVLSTGALSTTVGKTTCG